MIIFLCFGIDAGFVPIIAMILYHLVYRLTSRKYCVKVYFLSP